MVVYCISLKKDVERRERLRAQFSELYSEFIIIDAVDFREKGPPVRMDCERNKHKPLSNAEIGCALSHMEVYKMFVSSGHNLGLVIEDDIIGGDDDIRSISNVAKNISDGGLLICGGQDGTKGYNHLRGRPVFNNFAYQIPKPFFRFLSRTCCYVITPKVAKHLISKQTACLDRADHWRCLLGGVGGGVYFVDRISHPIDLRGSHIENSRPRSGVIGNVIADGFFYTVMTQIIKILPSFNLHKIKNKENKPSG